MSAAPHATGGSEPRARAARRPDLPARLRLARFALGRVLAPAWLALAFVAALALGSSPAPSAASAQLARERAASAPESAGAAREGREREPEAGEDALAVARAGGRARALALVLLAVAPVVLAGAARLGRELGGSRGAWLRARASSAGAASALATAGVLGAAGLVLGAALFAAELGRGAGARPLARLAWSPPAARSLWVEKGRPLRVEGLRPPAGTSELGLELALAHGAPIAAVEGVLRSASGATRAASTRLLGAGELRIALPPGGAPYALELATEHPRALLCVPLGRSSAWRPCGGEREASVRLLAHAALGTGWIVLALGLGAWMRASLATALVGALWSAGALSGLAAWPGGALAEGLELVARARAPSWPTAALVLGALALALAGWLALAAGLARRGGSA